VLRGQREQRVRWERCVGSAGWYLGEALGRYYVERAFAGDSKDVAVEMIHNIEGALEAALPGLTWMDDATREKAREKIGALTDKIGYPDTWRDYSGMDALAAGDWFGNAVAARRHGGDHQDAKLGQPVDRGEWFMPPSAVNAYYNPQFNEIVFPAGILQPPFFDAALPPAMNYGAIGMVMGHEITHGFDDSGRKFDPQGRMAEWWAPEAAEAFEERAACVVEQYGAFEVRPGLAVDGALTLGENIADIGGMKEAYAAWRGAAEDPAGPSAIDGLSGEQLFFVASAQAWCTLSTPEVEEMMARIDSHSPPRFRINGSVANVPAFGEAFQCPTGAPMRPAEICEVW